MKLFLSTFLIVSLFSVALSAALQPRSFFLDPRVINGKEAEPHSAPYIVSLKFLGAAHTCGGSIIDKSWVVTAGHCVGMGMGYISMAVAGLHNRLGLFESGVQRKTINKIYVHEKYDGQVGPYDIALLHLRSPFEFDDFVQPISLPPFQKVHSDKVTLYGWGKATGTSFPWKLQTVTVNALPYDQCKLALPEDAPLYDNNICTDAMQSGISACNGDSGGPLVEEHADGRRELVGVVSWGYIPCGANNFPSVFTRVSAYNDWIAEKMSEYETKL